MGWIDNFKTSAKNSQVERFETDPFPQKVSV